MGFTGLRSALGDGVTGLHPVFMDDALSGLHCVLGDDGLHRAALCVGGWRHRASPCVEG
jgi:hypothetical protein